MDKRLYIIAGCNGAGKTTASYTVLPDILDCREFVNADEIARGLSPFNPRNVTIEAGRLMIQRINELLGSEMRNTVEIVRQNKPRIDRLVKALLKKNKLTKEEIEKLLKG